jgi:hypothetical protein
MKFYTFSNTLLKFIFIHGIRIFVNFVGSSKPRNLLHNERHEKCDYYGPHYPDI